MTLAEQVLDEIAKTYKHHKVKGGGGGWNCFKTFAEMEEYYFGTNPYYTNKIKKTVELALQLSQAEIEEVIEEASESIERVSKQEDIELTYSAGQRCVILFLKERLLARSEQAKKEAKKNEM